MRKIFVIGGDSHYANWMEGEVIKVIERADLVVLTGGADINPQLYNRLQHPKTYFSDVRDAFELEWYKIARDLNKPIVGICRGAQFLCAMAGGTLIQHQEDPHYFHPVTIPGGGKITMTSLHHQAMYPWGLPNSDYKVLGWTIGNSRIHEAWSEGIEMLPTCPPCGGREVEFCAFPKIRALGIQGHPEMMVGKMDLNPAIKDSIAYCRMLLNDLIENKL